LKLVVGPVVQANTIPRAPGESHTITLGAAKTLRRNYPQLSFLQLDALADLRDSYEDLHMPAWDDVLAELALWSRWDSESNPEENLFIKEGRVKTFFWHRWRNCLTGKKRSARLFTRRCT